MAGVIPCLLCTLVVDSAPKSHYGSLLGAVSVCEDCHEMDIERIPLDCLQMAVIITDAHFIVFIVTRAPHKFLPFWEQYRRPTLPYAGYLGYGFKQPSCRTAQPSSRGAVHKPSLIALWERPPNKAQSDLQSSQRVHAPILNST